MKPRPGGGVFIDKLARRQTWVEAQKAGREKTCAKSFWPQTWVTGGNFAIANTGSIVLVSNGNIRM
jgi:L-lactate utilization protein LutB